MPVDSLNEIVVVVHGLWMNGAEAGLLKAVVAGLVANAIWLVPIIAITRFWEGRAGR